MLRTNVMQARAHGRKQKNGASGLHIPPINHESRRLHAYPVGVVSMKKLALVMAAIVTLLSVSGCVGIGKGKAPPPIITKG